MGRPACGRASGATRGKKSSVGQECVGSQEYIR